MRDSNWSPNLLWSVCFGILGNSFVQGLPVRVRPASVVLGGTAEAAPGLSQSITLGIFLTLALLVDVTKAIRSGVAHILSGNEGNNGAGSKYRMGGDVHDRGSRIQWMEGSAGQGRE